MAKEEECDTSLALGLGRGLSTAPGKQTHRAPVAHSEPSLALSISDEIHTKRKAPEDGSGPSGLRVSPPHSTVSSGSFSMVVKKEKDSTGEDGEVERVPVSRGGDEDEDGCARKKLRLTKEQSALLEDKFKEHNTLNPKQKQELAKQLSLRPRQVEVWFQNRRARTKLKQTEVDCEFLRRCCETLTEQNRRLHKELQELKALKLAAPMYMQLPAATLTMCPSCERIAGTGETPNPGASHFINPFTHPAAC